MVNRIFNKLSLSSRLWISEERRWQEELSSLGDLSDQWHTRQMALLNQHVTLINIYNMALDTLDVAAHSGMAYSVGCCFARISCFVNYFVLV